MLEGDHGSEFSSMHLRVLALETILTEKGYLTSEALDQIVEVYETQVGPHIGAKIVAHAWTHPEFKRALLEDANAAIDALDSSFQPPTGACISAGYNLTAVENTPQIHNMVVCTLCSCYPWNLLGLPPACYKSTAYRSRAVKDPRSILTEFGTRLPDDTAVRVWDSTAQQRYIVIPVRPDGTDSLSEEALATIVTRDSMIGTALVHRPLATDKAAS